MAICINNNCIDFGTFSIKPTAEGMLISGEFFTKTNEQFTGSPNMQGTVSGYTSGGMFRENFSNGCVRDIRKMPFASEGNLSDVGDLTSCRTSAGGHSSSDRGFVTNGRGTPGTNNFNSIQSFPYASDTNSTEVGNFLGGTCVGGYGHSSHSSPTDGFIAEGEVNIPSACYPVISKFPFATAVGVAVGTLQKLFASGKRLTSQSSISHGYRSGDYNGPAEPNCFCIINKFPFSGENIETACIGTLTQSRSCGVGVSSETHGYTAGGRSIPLGPDSTSCIDKFPFASDTNASGVGTLSLCRFDGAGISSTTDGFVLGGHDIPTACNGLLLIDKFPFASDTNASCIGDIAPSVGCQCGTYRQASSMD